MPHIKINQPTEGWFGTTIEVDGNKIGNVKSIDYHVGVDETPLISLEVIGSTEIDMDAEYVTVDISPTNVQEATAILRWELAKDNPRCEHLGINNELREAFISSIWSVLNEYHEFVELEISKGELAEKILDRIIGED